MSTRYSGWVAYVGPFQYPAGEAASRRVAAMAATIAAGGRPVVIVSGSATEDVLDAKELPPGDIRHVAVKDAPNHISSPLTKVDLVLRRWGAATVAWLDTQRVKPSHVVVYGGLAVFAWHVMQWCRRNGVAFIVDVVEWHAPRQLAGGRVSPLYLSSEVAMRYVYPRADAALCISTLLADHFARRGVAVAVVPPTVTAVVPPDDVPVVHAPDELQVLYFGSAGRKDRVDLIVEAVRDCRAVGGRIRLNLAGSFPPNLAIVEGVQMLGRVSPGAMPQTIRNHDFTVILREELRFTRAGFPTKYVESMANATPVITNLTSDIERYSDDGSDSLHVSACSAPAMTEALGRACALSDTERNRMRWHARQRAMDDFMYTAYIDTVDELLARSGT